MSDYPDGLRYTKEHEWIRVEGDRGRVGITHYAQKQLGDVVFVELPEAGRRLTPGEAFGSVESVKAVSELYAPVAGEVVEANAALGKAPEAVNSDPYGAGWMIVIQLSDPGAAARLLDADQYRALVESESK
jgi:glycine cleavage system H protein